MWFKHRAWIPIAWILSLINVASVWFAAQPAEPWHATAHAVLAVLFGLGAQRLSLRRKLTTETGAAARVGAVDPPSDLNSLQDMEGRLADLEERLDFTERALVDVRNRVPPPPKE